ncbi:uncharacterized protein LOC142529690 isoform X1 [Primulina tabacum]|uniref:uncharacterized protein LOC142529690 isoform X1 n=1 Tax=Primulina tabacum TaxID=48773 RepID=UPI003F5AAA15
MVEMAARRKCRLWWPENLSSHAPSNFNYLFGWFISSSEASIDIVVAFACDEPTLSSSIAPRSDVQEFLRVTNENMPAFLQNKCKFSLLGSYVAEHSVNGQSAVYGNDKKTCKNSATNRQCLSRSPNACTNNSGSLRCGCHKLDGLFEQVGLAALENTWIKFVCGLTETVGQRIRAIPKIDHLHWNGEIVFQLDIHVIIYVVPTFNDHHYCLDPRGSFNSCTTPCKKPKWFDELHQKDSHLNLDAVIMAMNTASAAQMMLSRCLNAESGIRFRIVYMIKMFIWKAFSIFVASLSTVIYIFLQYAHILFGCMSHTFMYSILGNVFCNTRQSILLRSCQLLYWPFFLQDHGKRSQTCVKFAEKAALHKHLMWSNIVVDVFLGNVFGILLWYLAEPCCLWFSSCAHDITNHCLSTSVWLMGNPAGFKLNTELAGVLGMISLNGIQFWSTLWVFMSFLFIKFLKGLAICGIFLGLTTAAALIIDTISIATIHVLTFHLFLSLLYSCQIQTVAALWRLFRGRKWNPLRQRLDSYDYTVEQHVVGSLLFTPILLLLPTTSAFYIFFSGLHTAVSFICLFIGVTISIIHATPYSKIFIWLKTKKRFPSGIWFEVASCKCIESGAVNDGDKSTRKLHNTACAGGKSTILVLFLRSNYLNLGEVVWPHYRHVYGAFSKSSIISSAYSLLTGTSTRSYNVMHVPSKLPWMVIPWKEYWHLCHDSVYACRPSSCKPYS